MNRPEASRLLLAGVGNPTRGDDGVGAAVIAALAGRLPAGVLTLTGVCAPARLLEAFEGIEAAWLVDAALGGGKPGTVTRLDLACDALPAAGEGHASSHGFGLATTLELARALGRLPASCVVFAVAAQGFNHGATLSAPVRDAVPAIAERMLGEIRQEVQHA